MDKQIVVNGNHENNAPWKDRAHEILTNGIFLKNNSISLDFKEKGTLKFHGTDFYWNVKGHNPYFDTIPTDTDVLIVHNPPKGKDAVSFYLQTLTGLTRSHHIQSLI